MACAQCKNEDKDCICDYGPWREGVPVIPKFEPMPKIGRLSRGCVITEKIDGTNASIYISDDLGLFLTASRTRWITPQDDNYGFSRWAHANKEELMKLGPGHHFGEWWGAGIQRRYGLSEKRFSLFNVNRWRDGRDTRPAVCSVVPILYEGLFEASAVEAALNGLRLGGSVAAPGFMQPEGIVVYHQATKTLFKKTLDKDEQPKSKSEE
jgi:RNA ligase-like protein